ncbi:Chemokine C-C motif receptor-like 2 [Galemys pyrenaicus]|uniref:Chemokine C-C motif receptor-like 2 n=1 Tax=Galemys pyrenaicus TaxID=202257 RepID=A0A8J6AM12_GALPY|nr:Chemokine C-C motif receptor-like 2 [Galemys pyrenaicus]
MANHTSAPEDDYDVLIEGELNATDHKAAQCTPYDTRTLSAGLVPQLYSALFVAGFLGHAWLVFVLIKRKGLRHVENVYFLNLAISNLSFLLTLPFWAHAASHGGILGDPRCKILVGLSVVGLYGQVLWNALLMVQRCAHLRMPTPHLRMPTPHLRMPTPHLRMPTPYLRGRHQACVQDRRAFSGMPPCSIYLREVEHCLRLATAVT